MKPAARQGLDGLCRRGAWLAAWPLALFIVAAPNTAAAAVLDWSARPATNLLSSSDSATAGGVTVTTSGAGAGSATSRSVQIAPAATQNGHSGIVQSIMDATTDNGSVSNTVTFTFSRPVYNLSFTVVDIDGGTNRGWNDLIQFTPFPVATFTGSNVTYNPATGQAASNGAAVSNATGDLTVSFAGPVTSVTVQHIAVNAQGNNPGSQVISIDDLTFTPGPTLQVVKESTGGIGTFDFSGGNGIAAHSVTTLASDTPASGPVQILTTANAETAVTETPTLTFILSTASCSGMGAGGSASLSGTTLTLDAAATAPGSDIVCTFLNAAAAPGLAILKAADTVGPVSLSQVITYSYRVTNTGNVAVANINVADLHNGYGAAPVPSSEALATDVAPLGDSTDAAANGIWDTLGPGDSVTFTAAYTVTQADIDLLQ